ncbi:hypothetical protein [Castellaniella denitrificans]
MAIVLSARPIRLGMTPANRSAGLAEIINKQTDFAIHKAGFVH